MVSTHGTLPGARGRRAAESGLAGWVGGAKVQTVNGSMQVPLNLKTLNPKP